MIRTLGPTDLAAMRALLACFGEAFEDRETYGAEPPSDAWLAALLARDTFVAVVAEDDGVVVGGLAAYILPKFERERSECYIYDLAIAESHRRRGLATACIDELGRVAAARGAWVLFVQADHGDEPAIALYTKLGVREEVLHFDIVPRR